MDQAPSGILVQKIEKHQSPHTYRAKPCTATWFSMKMKNGNYLQQYPQIGPAAV
jgi:hypothetical protein